MACVRLWEAMGHHLGVGEHSLMSWGPTDQAWMYPGLHRGQGCLVLSLLDIQVPLDAADVLRTEGGLAGWI